jgi:hypothetical protein
MKIEREVFQDLVTLDQSGLASEATRKLIDQCRTDHPDWIVDSVPAPALPRLEPPSDLERRSLERTQKLLRQRSWILGVALAFTFLPFTVVFTSRVNFLLYRDWPLAGAALYAIAIGLWAWYVAISRRLTMLGLVPRSGRYARWWWIVRGMLIALPAGIMLSRWSGNREPLATIAAVAFIGLVGGLWAGRASKS